MPRSKTKTKILQEALRQFNEQGIDRVTIRSIGQVLNMSAGNVSYHYKNTDTILYELYLDLVAAIDQRIFELQGKPLDLFLLHEQLQSTTRLFFEYRYLLMEFVAVTRRVEAIKQHFHHLVHVRQQQFKLFIDLMIQQGLLQKEAYEGQHLELISSSIIFSNAWLTDAHLHFDPLDERVIPFYARLQFLSIRPLLTEKGLAQFIEITDAHYPTPFQAYTD